MIYIFSGFVFGLLIPYIARRFSKFMPATMAYGLYRLVWPIKTVCRQKRLHNVKYQRLKRQYIMRSIGWGIVSAGLSYAAHICLPSDFYIALIWILLALYEIDKRMFLLPDILTVPLLILGFVFAATRADFALLSALGAAAGYILPVISSLLIVKKYPEAFGGGDIKLLAAVGAWIGLSNVPILLVASCIVFGAFCLIKHERTGAFGPAIVISTIGLVFYLHLM
ncbi:MAG: prepilin peptidase [Alphaproteobacteria bacterium]|nr:prepilin peptidase [Alphaproteobacteria bacterium]